MPAGRRAKTVRASNDKSDEQPTSVISTSEALTKGDGMYRMQVVGEGQEQERVSSRCPSLTPTVCSIIGMQNGPRGDVPTVTRSAYRFQLLLRLSRLSFVIWSSLRRLPLRTISAGIRGAAAEACGCFSAQYVNQCPTAVMEQPMKVRLHQ